ncbi:UPF0764 protein C16orf89 homolog [Bombina bombina]|uniref:UPF0764 protein C16orf89 homolog n=1 Tax=Bombina bombina TaxID=8345 RepID=UPI00235ACADD|nr:UPF0764 protein C16orf89 homolog [Bombina bombina]
MQGAAFKDIISDFFWVVPSSWNQTNAQLVYSHLVDSECYNEEFNEEFSDYCYRLVLGTWNNAGEPCIVSEPCLAHMTRPGCVNYTLSHQLLYFMTAKMKGCSQGLFLQQYAHYTDVFCANMMRRNLEIESDGFPPKEKDLFMENIMLCGLSGYSDFFKSDWMDTIISWQDPSGCFGSTDKVSKAKKESPILWRYKRREKKMPSGCLSHMTAVAAGALGGFLYSFQI